MGLGVYQLGPRVRQWYLKNPLTTTSRKRLLTELNESQRESNQRVDAMNLIGCAS